MKLLLITLTCWMVAVGIFFNLNSDILAPWDESLGFVVLLLIVIPLIFTNFVRGGWHSGGKGGGR